MKATWSRGQESVRYCRSFAGVWPDVTEWIEASVSTWDDGWEARCSTGLPNVDREQWNTRKVFRTRGEAAAYAAAFVLVSEEIVAAMRRGEAPTFPHRRMRAACAEEIERLPRILAARGRLAVAETHRQRGDARDELRTAILDEETAWYRAHDFRYFVAAEPATLDPPTEEDEHAARIDPAA